VALLAEVIRHRSRRR